jgi:rhodanese-related sulfurtransferase
VQRKVMSRPDATVVLPGHGYQDVLFTTIGHERAHNAALKHADGRAYAASLHAVEGAGNTPDVDVTLETNLAAEPTLPDSPTVAAACCSMGAAPIAGPKVKEKKCEELAPSLGELAKQSAWIDVRDPWELKKDGRIPGVRNIPLSELGFHLDEVRRDAPMILSCRSGVRSMTAAKTLAYLGILKEPISMSGGFGRWKELGLPTE